MGVDDWWDEIETFIEIWVTNAGTEAAKTAIKHFKRTGTQLPQSPALQARILLRSHRGRHTGGAHA